MKALVCALMIMIAGILVDEPPKIDSRLDIEPRGRLPLTLILEMMAVCLEQGASIPRTLSMIGTNTGGSYAPSLPCIAGLLEDGNDWNLSWSQGLRDSLLGEELFIIKRCLEPSWRYGQSPLLGIDSTVAELERHARSGLEEEAASLSVRLLLPTGLCILPAFILIGVVPCIASFAGGIFTT